MPPVCEDGEDVAAQVDDKSEERSRVAEQVKIEEMLAIRDLKKKLHKAEVGGRADREKFGDSLDDS